MVKMYDSVGCSIEGLNNEDVIKFKDAGWKTEEEYRKENKDKEGDK